MTNKIHFVGAGPGDKELITLKGYKLTIKCRCGNICRFTGKSRAS